MRRIAVTPPWFYPGEAGLIADALRSGVYWRVHIRKPHADAARLRALLEAVDADLRPRITLHDGIDMAGELGYGGVHLSARSPEAPAGWGGLVSRPAHSLEELDRLECDYQLLSPVYPSISKPGHNPPFTLADAAQAARDARIPVVALGGVTEARLGELEEAGFYGAAMLTEAWSRRMPMDAFRLQFITHDNGRTGTEEGARLALEGGCRWIQLRIKGAADSRLLEAGRRIGAMCQEAGAVFLIDDHPHLVPVLGADGVHLGKNDMPVAEARTIVGPRAIIGSTANTLEDILAAQAAGADYIGLGPFRFTTTKERLSPVLGTEGYRRILGAYRTMELGRHLPVVAIGGITDADIPAIMQAGAAGIALSSSILTAPEPAAATAQVLRTIRKSI
ncbi:MAG: thiamine phosphate synthase [Muribaculaceae bacterium]|nr:thiamine phosphate synthase [Muribaculaceae bacterium]